MVRCKWLCSTNGGERVLTSTLVCQRAVRRCLLSTWDHFMQQTDELWVFVGCVCELLTLLWLSRRGSGIMLGKLAQPEG